MSSHQRRKEKRKHLQDQTPGPAPTNVMTNDAATKQSKVADGFDNFVSRIGMNNNNQFSAGLYTFNLMTKNRIQLEAAYRGSWVVGVVVDAVAEDMTRAGINIFTGESARDIKDLETNISRLQLWSSLKYLMALGRLYGGALGVIQIEGQDLATPLKLDTIAKDQFRGIAVFDRWQLNPDTLNVIDSGPEIGLPKFYNIVTTSAMDESLATKIGQIRVHHSRVIRSIGIQLPYFQAITELLWGESVLERLWDRLIAFDNATMSSAQLIDKANLRMVGIEGLREIIAAGGKAQQGLEAQFDMMRELQSNEGLTLLDKNDEYQTTAYSFAGLSDMMLQFGQQLAGASGIPLVRLFGQAPAGLSATGDSDIRMYYDNINALQESRMRPGWQLLLQVLWRSTYGEAAPKDLAFTFNPLWQMSALDKATIAKSNTETILGAFDSGITSKVTTLKELQASSGDTGLFSNISDEDIAEAESEPPPMPEVDNPDEEPKIEDPTKPPVKNLDSVTERVKKFFKGK